jgi:hypothetical protein
MYNELSQKNIPDKDGSAGPGSQDLEFNQTGI